MKFQSKLLASAISCSLALHVTAQDHDDSPRFTLEEIVVSARKIEESAQDIPLAINVMDSSTFKDLKIQDVTDVVSNTPGATFTANFPGEQNLSVRGISSGDSSASGSSGVLMMADNEVISRGFMYTSALFDVSRVEVLRGPQGTTYGKNATGGVVHAISNLPTDETEVELKSTVGNYDLFGLEGVVNHSLTENAAGRLAFYHQQREGYSKDALTGKTVDDNETIAIKSAVTVDATDDLTLTFRAHWSQDNLDNPAPRKALDPSQPDAFRFNPSAFTSTDVSENPYQVRNSSNLFYDRTIWGASIEAMLAFESFDLTSITAYRNGEDSARVDLFGSYEDIVLQNSSNEAYTLSQELRLDNAAYKEGSLTWLAGFFYLKEDHEHDELREIFVNNPIFEISGLSTNQAFEQKSSGESLGVFGELNWDLTESTQLAVGGRYSYEKKDYEVFHQVTGGTAASPLGGTFANTFIADPSQPVIADTDETWSSVTGRLSLTHQIGEDLLLYATVANGFKAGGFNPEPRNVEAATTAYDEETLLNIELGMKAELLDNRLRLNFAMFDSEYEDIQRESFLASGTVIVDNAGEATIRGVEAEFTWLLSEQFTLVGSYANYESKYTEFIDNGVDLSGEELPNVPRWTGHIGAIYEIPLEEKGYLRVRADYHSRSDILAIRDDVVGNVDRPNEDIFNAQISWMSEDDKWEAVLWGQNLTDKAEVLVVGPSALGTQPHVTYGSPRTYGVSLTYRMY